MPSSIVSGVYIHDLWKAEISAEKPFRWLHHLRNEDLNPSNFDKMNVGAAIRFFSLKTSAGLELGVKLKLIHEEALTTAWFIRQVHQWFQLMNSRLRKTSITKRNKMEKHNFLYKIIIIFEGILFGKSLKPLNCGVILSVIDVTDYLIMRGYDFVLTHRFNQDALETVFSQVRRRGGKTPSALACLRALKIITISQFVSDVKKSSYCSDTDIFLIDYFSKKKTHVEKVNSHVPVINTNVEIDLSMLLDTYSLDSFKTLNMQDQNMLFFIGGAVVNKLLKKSLCEECKIFLEKNSLKDSKLNFNYYVKQLEKGGLIYPNSFVFQIILNCDIIYMRFFNFIMHNNSKVIIDKISTDINISFPSCCNIKEFIVNYFFTVRSFALVSLSCAVKRKKTMYGTVTLKKKKFDVKLIIHIKYCY